jgi:hypothetical protein
MTASAPQAAQIAIALLAGGLRQGGDVTPKLLEPGDYGALAEHFKRQNAETDHLEHVAS